MEGRTNPTQVLRDWDPYPEAPKEPVFLGVIPFSIPGDRSKSLVQRHAKGESFTRLQVPKTMQGFELLHDRASAGRRSFLATHQPAGFTQEPNRGGVNERCLTMSQGVGVPQVAIGTRNQQVIQDTSLASWFAAARFTPLFP